MIKTGDNSNSPGFVNSPPIHERLYTSKNRTQLNTPLGQISRVKPALMAITGQNSTLASLQKIREQKEEEKTYVYLLIIYICIALNRRNRNRPSSLLTRSRRRNRGNRISGIKLFGKRKRSIQKR